MNNQVPDPDRIPCLKGPFHKWKTLTIPLIDPETHAEIPGVKGKLTICEVCECHAIRNGKTGAIEAPFKLR